MVRHDGDLYVDINDGLAYYAASRTRKMVSGWSLDVSSDSGFHSAIFMDDWRLSLVVTIVAWCGILWS